MDVVDGYPVLAALEARVWSGIGALRGPMRDMAVNSLGHINYRKCSLRGSAAAADGMSRA